MKTADVLKSATISRASEKRADVNRRFGNADFGEWVKSWLNKLPTERVLDLCCGTGNQLVLYAARRDCRVIVGVDISQESLDVATSRLAAMNAVDSVTLECADIDDEFVRPALVNRDFNLLSCFYGLYYAANPAAILKSAADAVTNGGAVVVVGPYGRNNASLFEILERHYELPELVVKSATTFMVEVVVPALNESLSVRRETFLNRVHYPDSETLLDYWRASTFYNGDKHEAVATDIEHHFSQHGEFVVEKHVMAVIGVKETT